MIDEILDLIDEYCQRNGYEDMLVTLQADGDVLTVVLEFDGNNMTWCWSWDWYEGQRQVDLLGYVPLQHVRVFDEEVYIIE